MTNTYRAITKPAIAAYGEGDLELDLDPDGEKDVLANGLLELVPRTYKILSDNYHQPNPDDPDTPYGVGDTFEAALLVEVEAALISGGHIKRVDPKPADKAAAKSTPKSKEK